MFKYIFPKMKMAEASFLFKCAFVASLIAGTYGVIHDQITYSISSEYFEKVKFQQFDYANFGFQDRIFVGEIGFMASWWVGFFCIWFVGRYALGKVTQVELSRLLISSFLIILSCCLFIFEAPPLSWLVLLFELASSFCR